MSNLQSEVMRASTHTIDKKWRGDACRHIGTTVFRQVVLSALVGTMLSGCTQITPPPTGPLPDCFFPPSTELCGHKPTVGPHRDIPF